jgi:hypothetical protein
VLGQAFDVFQAKPAAFVEMQAPEQLPPVQVWPAEQAWPQEPQLFMSLAKVAHVPPAHCVSPAGQLAVQLPPLQTSVAEQAIAQLPQWLLSEATQTLLHARSPAAH